MIRRWTFVNYTNSLFADLTLIHKYLFFINVKKNVKYKKFIFFKTKRRRKHTTRRKQITNLLLLHLIYADWVIDYRDKKSVFRYQFYHKSFINSFISFEPLIYKKPAKNDLEHFDAVNYITTHQPAKLFKYLQTCNLTYCNPSIFSTFRFFFKVHTFYPASKETRNTDTIPLLRAFDNTYYLSKPIIFDFNDWIFFHTLSITLELYKNLNYLWFYFINKNISYFVITILYI